MSDKEAVMECPRCKGMVVREWLPEAIEEEYQLRCLNCGWTAPLAFDRPPRLDLEAIAKNCCCAEKNGHPSN
jgi:hypothetical protein